MSINSPGQTEGSRGFRCTPSTLEVRNMTSCRHSSELMEIESNGIKLLACALCGCECQYGERKLPRNVPRVEMNIIGIGLP